MPDPAQGPFCFIFICSKENLYSASPFCSSFFQSHLPSFASIVWVKNYTYSKFIFTRKISKQENKTFSHHNFFSLEVQVQYKGLVSLLSSPANKGLEKSLLWWYNRFPHPKHTQKYEKRIKGKFLGQHNSYQEQTSCWSPLQTSWHYLIFLFQIEK